MRAEMVPGPLVTIQAIPVLAVSPFEDSTEYSKCHRYSSHRNAVSHGSFDIRFNYAQNEYIVDFGNVLTGYQFNKNYTGNQLLMLYSDYDKLRDIQELLIRIAFLKATLRSYFFKN